jgi:hypothetical protein
MKRVLAGVIAATFAATVGLAAQNPQQPGVPGAPSPAAPAAPSPRDQVRTPGSLEQATPGAVTISGCVQNAPAASATASAGSPGAPAPSASASASSGSQRFVLANAKASSTPGAGSTAVGTSGTAAARYELEGMSGEVSKHLNHQVEITGTVQPSSPAAAAGAAAPAKLTVTAVKMVSATCDK